MTRGAFHWSRNAGLHPGVDPDACPVCEDDEIARLEAIAMHPASTQQEARA